MPRFDLGERDVELLTGYLETLSAASPPGVSNSELHFATIVTDGVPERQRRAMLDVMNAFIQAKNAEIRRGLARKPVRTALGHGRDYREHREWRLHVWTLNGPAVSWAQQLDRYARTQPVYALLSGVGRDRWQEIQASCERLELPCLFPNTPHPEILDGEFFTMYFSGGVTQEAQVLAQTLFVRSGGLPSRIVQVYRQHDSGEVAAAALRRTLGAIPEGMVQDLVLTEEHASKPDFWQSLFADADAVVALWLGAADLARIPHTSVARASLYVSDILLNDQMSALPEPLRTRTRVLRLRE